MGCRFSCKASNTFNCVRVIHINGYVEDFEAPVTTSQVTGKPPKHVLCSSAQLLSPGTQPLRPDDRLEPGRFYFLLPHSVFLADSSPIDLASLVTRLTALARRGGSALPGPGLDRIASANRAGAGNSQPVGLPGGWRFSTRAWRPELDTIEERSLGRSMRDSSRSSSYSYSTRSLTGLGSDPLHDAVEKKIRVPEQGAST